MRTLPFILLAVLGSISLCEACGKEPEPTPPSVEPTPTTVEPITTTVQPTPLSVEPITSTAGPTKSTIEPTPSTAEPTTSTVEPTTTAEVFTGCKCAKLEEYTGAAFDFYEPGTINIMQGEDANGCSQVTLTCTANGNYRALVYPSSNLEALVSHKVPDPVTGLPMEDNCGTTTVVSGVDETPFECKGGAWVDVSTDTRNTMAGCAYTTIDTSCPP